MNNPYEDYQSSREKRFDLYPDQERVTLIPSDQLNSLSMSFHKMSKFVSMITGIPVDKMSEEKLRQYIDNNDFEENPYA